MEEEGGVRERKERSSKEIGIMREEEKGGLERWEMFCVPLSLLLNVQ